MKVTLEFELPKDNIGYEHARRGAKYYGALRTIEAIVRYGQQFHGDPPKQMGRAELEDEIRKVLRILEGKEMLNEIDR